MQEDLTKKLEQSLHENLVHALHTYSAYERDYLENNHNDIKDMESINATKAKETNPSILRLLDSLTKEIKSLKAKAVFKDPNNNNITDLKDDLPTINPRTNKPYKRYCWTHGCGNHWSNRCRNPKAGHKNEATFKDRMGGSNKGCLPAN